MRLEEWQREHGFPIWNETKTERRMEGDPAMTTTIWDTYAELYPIPEGMIDSTWHHNECPSYESADGTVQVWLLGEPTPSGEYFEVRHSRNGDPIDHVFEQDVHYDHFTNWIEALAYLTQIVNVKGE